MTKKELIKSAVAAKDLSYSPYSNFRVGSALQTKKGIVYSGANVENASYSLTICAERTAVFAAVLAGEQKFKNIAITSDSEEFIPPCGSCRQVLMEFCGPELDVIMTNSKNKSVTFKLKELLPHSFGEDFLK